MASGNVWENDSMSWADRYAAVKDDKSVSPDVKEHCRVQSIIEAQNAAASKESAQPSPAPPTRAK